MYVKSGTKQRIYLILPKLHSFKLIQLLYQLRIVRTSLKCTAWKRECLGSAVHPNTRRSVRACCNRHSEILVKPIRYSSECRCHTGRNLGWTHSFASWHMYKIFIRKLIKIVIKRYFSAHIICELISLITCTRSVDRSCRRYSFLKVISTLRRPLFCHSKLTIRRKTQDHSLQILSRSAGIQTLQCNNRVIKRHASYNVAASYIATFIEYIFTCFKHVAILMSRYTGIIETCDAL